MQYTKVMQPNSCVLAIDVLKYCTFEECNIEYWSRNVNIGMFLRMTDHVKV